MIFIIFDHNFGFHQFLLKFHLDSPKSLDFDDFQNMLAKSSIFRKWLGIDFLHLFYRATIDLAEDTVKSPAIWVHMDLFSRQKCEQLGVFSYNYAVSTPFLA